MREGTSGAGFAFEPHLVDAFIEGDLDAGGEAQLADQVARVLAYHSAPNLLISSLEKLRHHLGGDAALFGWLRRHPGRPRALALLYAAIDLLDRFSDRDAVVTALRESRERTPYPLGLRGYLVPGTGEQTLASLSGIIESLLSEGEFDRAVSVALAALAMLRDVAARAAELDPDLRTLGPAVERTAGDLAEAGAIDLAGGGDEPVPGGGVAGPR